MRHRKRTAVLISGNGSNLQALIDASHAEDYPAEIVLVISNKADAYGLTRAEQAGIASVVIDHKAYDGREAFDAALQEALDAQQVELVCLAGFMRLLTPGFAEAWHGQMINIHPSLLPAFKGLDTHSRVLESGAWFGGCSVHFVVPDMDAGPIILQAAVPVEPGDTPDSLQQRIHVAEHMIFPKALAWLAAGKLSIDENRVHIEGNVAAGQPSINPNIGD